MNTVDINGAAEMLQVHPKTVLDLIGNGSIPAGKVGRAYVMLTRDVMAYVEMVIRNQTSQRMGIKAKTQRGLNPSN